MKLEDLEIYKLSIEIAERVWNIALLWKQFEKGTIGKQILISADSIAANISE